MDKLLFNDLPDADIGPHAKVAIFSGCQWADITIDGIEVAINVEIGRGLRDWLNRALPVEPEQLIADAHSRLLQGLYEWQNAAGSLDEVVDGIRQMAEACIAASKANAHSAPACIPTGVSL